MGGCCDGRRAWRAAASWTDTAHARDLAASGPRYVDTAEPAIVLGHAHTLAEGAGAAALAGLRVAELPDDGRPVAVVCTGGNASAEEIADLSRPATLEGCSTPTSRAG